MAQWLWGTNPQNGVYAGRLHVVLDEPGAAGGWAACGLRVAAVTVARPVADGRVLCPECCLAAVDHVWPPPAEPVTAARRYPNTK